MSGQLAFNLDPFKAESLEESTAKATLGNDDRVSEVSSGGLSYDPIISGSDNSSRYFDDRETPNGRTLVMPDPKGVRVDTVMDDTFGSRAAAEPVVVPRRTSTPRDRFITQQKWEGSVTEIHDDHFVGRLIDLTASGPDEEADFFFEEISDEDRALIQLGAVFYYSIVYRDSDSGQRTRESLIIFRRLPAWQKDDISSAHREARSLKETLDAL